MRISDWSSDVCSSDLLLLRERFRGRLLLRLLVGDALPLDLGLARDGGCGIGLLLLRAPGGGGLGAGDRGLQARQGRRLGVGLLHQRKQTLGFADVLRSEEHTSELPSLMRISYAV